VKLDGGLNLLNQQLKKMSEDTDYELMRSEIKRLHNVCYEMSEELAHKERTILRAYLRFKDMLLAYKCSIEETEYITNLMGDLLDELPDNMKPRE
jgi:hypothetical protein